MALFKLFVGLADGPFKRAIDIEARTSLEAGFIADEKRLIPKGYVAHSLVDTRLDLPHKRRVKPRLDTGLSHPLAD